MDTHALGPLSCPGRPGGPSNPDNERISGGTRSGRTTPIEGVAECLPEQVERKDHRDQADANRVDQPPVAGQQIAHAA